MIRGAILFMFITGSILMGSVLQEKSGVCIPEVHSHNPCHCLAMGGYRNCKEGQFSREEWIRENWRRQQDIDPNTGRLKREEVPKCQMDCHENNCKCCAYMDKMKAKSKKVSIAIPYDRL